MPCADVIVCLIFYVSQHSCRNKTNTSCTVPVLLNGQDLEEAVFKPSTCEANISAQQQPDQIHRVNSFFLNVRRQYVIFILACHNILCSQCSCHVTSSVFHLLQKPRIQNNPDKALKQMSFYVVSP